MISRMILQSRVVRRRAVWRRAVRRRAVRRRAVRRRAVREKMATKSETVGQRHDTDGYIADWLAASSS